MFGKNHFSINFSSFLSSTSCDSSDEGVLGYLQGRSMLFLGGLDAASSNEAASLFIIYKTIRPCEFIILTLVVKQFNLSPTLKPSASFNKNFASSTTESTSITLKQKNNSAAFPNNIPKLVYQFKPAIIKNRHKDTKSFFRFYLKFT